MRLHTAVQLRAVCALKKKAIRITVTLLVVACAAAQAWAGTFLDLSIGSGGTFAYGSGERHARFYGIGIKVRDLTVGTKELPLLKGRLNLSDSNFLGSHGSSYFWGPGGTLTVRGTLDGVTGTLLTGTFLSAKVVDVNGTEMLEAEIRDQLNPQLAALFHLSSASYTGQLDLVLSAVRTGHWWTHDKVQGGSLTDSGGNVPESSSIWLLGASLSAWMGVTLFRRRLRS